MQAEIVCRSFVFCVFHLRGEMNVIVITHLADTRSSPIKDSLEYEPFNVSELLTSSTNLSALTSQRALLHLLNEAHSTELESDSQLQGNSSSNQTAHLQSPESSTAAVAFSGASVEEQDGHQLSIQNDTNIQLTIIDQQSTPLISPSQNQNETMVTATTESFATAAPVEQEVVFKNKSASNSTWIGLNASVIPVEKGLHQFISTSTTEPPTVATPVEMESTNTTANVQISNSEQVSLRTFVTTPHQSLAENASVFTTESVTMAIPLKSTHTTLTENVTLTTAKEIGLDASVMPSSQTVTKNTSVTDALNLDMMTFTTMMESNFPEINSVSVTDNSTMLTSATSAISELSDELSPELSELANITVSMALENNVTMETSVGLSSSTVTENVLVVTTAGSENLRTSLVSGNDRQSENISMSSAEQLDFMAPMAHTTTLNTATTEIPSLTSSKNFTAVTKVTTEIPILTSSSNFTAMTEVTTEIPSLPSSSNFTAITEVTAEQGDLSGTLPTSTPISTQSFFPDNTSEMSLKLNPASEMPVQTSSPNATKYNQPEQPNTESQFEQKPANSSHSNHEYKVVTTAMTESQEGMPFRESSEIDYITKADPAKSNSTLKVMTSSDGTNVTSTNEDVHGHYDDKNKLILSNGANNTNERLAVVASSPSNTDVSNSDIKSGNKTIEHEIVDSVNSSPVNRTSMDFARDNATLLLETKVHYLPTVGPLPAATNVSSMY